MQTLKNGATPAAGVPDAKIIATTAAQFAIKGHALRTHSRQDGTTAYIVSRWSQSRHFTDWADVQAFLVQIGGAA